MDMTLSKACLFCEIIATREPAARIYETEDTLAFLDINPIVEGHALVIPKTHARNIFDLPEASMPGLMLALAHVARTICKAFNADGLNVFQSNEPAGGQTVFHVHFHLLPRFRNDGVVIIQDGYRQLNWRVLGHYRPTQLEPIAEKIRKAFRVTSDSSKTKRDER